MSEYNLNLHDIIEVKKAHPCGGNTWKILRMGMDFRIECATCKRQVMLPRAKFEKMIKKNLTATPKRHSQ